MCIISFEIILLPGIVFSAFVLFISGRLRVGLMVLSAPALTGLLMPLALGCLLGGPFTGISTPSNILVTDALSNAGLTPFAIFDFTPITGALVAVGITFMVLVGRHLLPHRSGGAETGHQKAMGSSYQLDTHIFTIRIPKGSPLQGPTLFESRLGSALYLTVLAIR